MKSTDMLEWMNGLNARYLAESEQPAIRQHKKRLMPALIAAAAAAVCLTVGVGAYMRYNREMVQFGFGTLGEARMAELAAPEPVTCSNGRVSVTVENVLSDGKQAMLLLTLEPVDKSQPFDWTEFDEDQNHAMRNRFLIGGEEYQSDIATGRPSENVFSEDGTNEAYEIMKAADQRWIKMYFTLPEDASDKALADAVFECFPDVRVGFIVLGGIEKINALIVGIANDLRAIFKGEIELCVTNRKNAESDRRYKNICVSESVLFHDSSL